MKKLIFLSYLTFLTLFFSANIFAQDENLSDFAFETFLFDKAVIAATTTKRDEITQESALNIRVITRADIENYGIENLQQLMLFLENTFESMKGRDRVYGVRGIMGYANDKIKFLIDGQEFPMELGLGEGQWPVTLDEVKKIEIVKGPNTSLFGANATQATINIIRFNGNDFVGLKTGIAVGSYNHKRVWLHYAEKPAEDFNYDFYFMGAYQKGAASRVSYFWHEDSGPGYGSNYNNDYDVTNPLPDYELIASTNYKNMKMTYRRVIQRRGFNDPNVYTHNYSDAIAAEYKKPHFFGNDNLDFIFSVEASHFGNWYDVYHGPNEMNGPIEHKAEKRLEWDAHFHYTDEDTWDILAGIGGNYWSAVGTEWGVYTLTTSPSDIPGFDYAWQLTSGISTPEYFPSFAEVNDLADWEAWGDFKYNLNDQLNIVLGGRYIYDFVPNDQLRDSNAIAKYNTDRELLRKFFPKAGIVYSPKEKMYLKILYQEGFNRPGTIEQFSLQNNIEQRGKLKATTAKTIELVFDWIINKNLKTLISIFDTKVNDFVNFAYTGSEWPKIEAGQFRGFYNIGDREIQGIEGNFELKYENWGSLLSFGYMNKNKIKPFAQFDPYNPSVADNATGNSGIIDNTDLNKQNFPEWNATFAGWLKIVDNITLSGVYKVHRNIKTNQLRTHWWLSNEEREITNVDFDTLDIILNAKNVLAENLNLQLMVQNALDADDLIGSAMDPVHAEQIYPRNYQAKVTYLW
ncbi:MAG: TonB-dependent receptor [Candidatus Aureabacteria bacterium]|nr:TonB-dependent receptor [Candidatus Auribacterota bacterium]